VISDVEFVSVKMLKQLGIGDVIYDGNEIHPLEYEL